MKNSIIQLIENRVSVSKYQKDIEIDDDMLLELTRLATRSPSAYNLQNWKFIAVKSKASKDKLQAAAYGQPQIASAAVTFIVCGQLKAHQQLSQRLQHSVEQGVMPENIAKAWVSAAHQSHEGNLSLQRDEAIRSASLASMTLMYAAQAMGYASGAMGGFDAEQVKASFELEAQDLPVMLVTIGIPEAGNWPQKVRRPTSELLKIL